VPRLGDAVSSEEMWDALVDLRHEFASFFIAFAVIGRYWLAHHRFVSVLGAVESRLMLVNLVYLAFVAFLPFPTALIGRYEDNLVAFAFYAVILAVISGLETVLFVVALRRGLLAVVVPPPVVRHGVVASTLPVAVFLISIPLALVAGSTVAILSWLLIWPLEALLDRRAPKGAEKLPPT
jgi:hypothetical protein